MWFLIISSRTAHIDAVKAITADHFVWMLEQHKQGTVIISGPTPDRTKGIYVIKAESTARAHEIAASDPFHMANLRTYELIPWEVHQMLGIGPFSLPGVEHLASNDPAPHYTHLPKS